MILAVKGPYEVNYGHLPGGRSIADDDISTFWTNNHKIAKRRGCYVFAMRAGKGYTPGYVGKTKRTFKSEVFGLHQLRRYHQFMAEYGKGKPVLFLVVAPKANGMPNNSKIREVEKYLISLAMAANPDLLNERDIQGPKWGIQGIIRGKKGNTTLGTKHFRVMLGIGS